MYRSGETRYILALTLAVLNDVVDFLGVISNPLVESALDVLLALGLVILLGFSPLPFLITIADALPGIDLSPMWTAYVLYRYLSERRVKVPVE